ncbi:putative gp36 [Roseibium sp. TrichSKD4]|uniref:DUF3164 family protein n=1 Tax=Roseibium sp. TrichSKD4 TaxID=744980 RepID=UPI0001E56938|nr:DUF3164 family protein [Roseibium sp. TrichSKD4]EFO32472.1 putative gp36 [Roseibium sp. TrichSKD4]
MTQEFTIPEGMKLNASGSYVPISNIKAKDLLQDEMVQELHDEMQQVLKVIEQFHAKCESRLDGMRELLDQEHGVRVGGPGGNVSFRTFDGELSVGIRVNERQEFGPELEQAKKLIDECLLKWADGSNPHLVTVVNQVFAVNKAGKLDMDRIRGLKNYEIEDETWQRAMAAIEDAVRSVGSKRNIRFMRRDPVSKKPVGISLDFSRM